MKRVLFVCVGNSCRSQMAEGFFTAMAGEEARARSVGSQPDHEVNPMAVRVMREVGVNISQQIPNRITEDMVTWADLVVLMGCEEDACPAVPKAMLDWDIEDPVGKEMEKFREVRDTIRSRVGDLIADAV